MSITWKASVLAVTALVGASLTAVTPASAAPVAEATPTPTVSTDAAKIITKSGRIVDFYTELGVTADEIPVIDAAHSEALQEVMNLVLEEPVEQPAAVAAANCSDTGAMVAQAQQVAAMNKARDARAKSLDEETVYMYMSHYFDLPSPCGNNAAYYPSWITNSDRQAYTNFLTSTNLTQLSTSTGQMILSATSLAGNPVPVFKKLWRGDSVDRLANGLDLADKGLAGETLVQEFETVSALLDAGATPEAIANGMNERLSTTWQASDTLGAIIGTGAALMMPTVGASVFGLGAVAVSMQLTGFNTLVQHAAYNALRYTTSSRTSARLMRSLGW